MENHVIVEREYFDRLKTEVDSLKLKTIGLEQENATIKNEMQLLKKMCEALENIKYNLEKTLEWIKYEKKNPNQNNSTTNSSSSTQISFERDLIVWQEEYTNIKMMLAANQFDYPCSINDDSNYEFKEENGDEEHEDDDETKITEFIVQSGNVQIREGDEFHGENDIIQVYADVPDHSIDEWEEKGDHGHTEGHYEVEFTDSNEHGHGQVGELQFDTEEDGSIVIRQVSGLGVGFADVETQKKARRTRKSFLADKMIVSNEPGQKRFICTWDQCTYSTSSSGNFQKHYRIHTGEKPYKCDFEGCNYCCSDPGSIKEHKRIHSAAKEFACSWKGCSWRFTTAKLLRNHERACHTGDKPHKCDWPGCDKSFLAPYALRTHKLKHQGVRPFKCDIGDCTKSFTRSNDLLRHKRETHCTEKKYVCENENCGARFFRRDDLRHHVKRKHEGTELPDGTTIPPSTTPTPEPKKKRIKNVTSEPEIVAADSLASDKPHRGPGRPRKKQRIGQEIEVSKVVIDLNQKILEYNKGESTFKIKKKTE